MDPREAQSPQNQDKARQRREEAVRRQQLQSRQQAAKIEEQRKLAARQKNAATSTQPGSARPAAASGRAAQAPRGGWTKVSEVVIDTAPSAVRTPMPATPTPPKPKPVVSAPKPRPPAAAPKPAQVALPPPSDDVAVAPPSEAEMRAEMAAFAHENIEPAAALPPPPLIDELPEIEITPAEVEMPELRLVDPKSPITASPVEETPVPLVVELPEMDPATENIGEAQFPTLKMADQPDLYCPKCQSLIPENQRGSFYTACARCGEIIKMK